MTSKQILEALSAQKEQLSRIECLLQKDRVHPDEFMKAMTLVREALVRLDTLTLGSNKEETVVKETATSSSSRNTNVNFLIYRAAVNVNAREVLEKILGPAILSELSKEIGTEKGSSESKEFGKIVWKHVKKLKDSGDSSLYNEIKERLGPLVGSAKKSKK